MKTTLTMQSMKHLKIWIMSVVVGTLLVASTLPDLASAWWDSEKKIREVLIKGADLHLSRQGDYINTCGGGYGPPDIDSISNTWEWVIGTGETCWNVGGISATGLLAAYERTRNRAYLEGALLQGDTLVSRYDTIVTNDPEGAEWEDRPFSQDIEFLVRLSLDSHDLSYAKVARKWYKIVTDNKTAEENADRYIDVRLSLAGWDLASHIRAALSVGKWQYACGMAKRLLERRNVWEHFPYNGWDYTMSSYGSLLWAFDDLDFKCSGISAAIQEFQDFVLGAQGVDGSWEDGDYQTTAYAILGLDAVEAHGYGLKRSVRQALGKAFSYFHDTQTLEGGWSYPPEYGEINSEVLMAIGGLRRWEVILPPGDPALAAPQKPAITPIQ